MSAETAVVTKTPLIRTVEGSVEKVLPGERSVVARVGSMEIDRYRTCIFPSGMDITTFNQRNPLFMWEHGASKARESLPIGRGWALYRKSEDDLIAKCIFRDDDFSNQLFEFYRDGTLTSWSVRVLPKFDVCGPPTYDEIRYRPELSDCNMMYRGSELLEVSAVGVPGNRDAISLLVSRGFLLPDGSRAMTESEGGLADGGGLVKPKTKGKVQVAMKAGKMITPEQFDGDPPSEFNPVDGGEEPEEEPGPKGGNEDPEASKRAMDPEDATNDDEEAEPMPDDEDAEGEGDDEGDDEGEERYIKEEDGQFVVYSEKGKRLGEYKSKKQADERLKQIEYFKHKGRSAEEIIGAIERIVASSREPEPKPRPKAPRPSKPQPKRDLTPAGYYIDTDESVWAVRRADGELIAAFPNASVAEGFLVAQRSPRYFADVHVRVVSEAQSVIQETEDRVIGMAELLLLGRIGP